MVEGSVVGRREFLSRNLKEMRQQQSNQNPEA